MNKISLTRHNSISTSSNPCTPTVQSFQNVHLSSKKAPIKNKQKNKVVGNHHVEKEEYNIHIVSQNINCIGVSNIITYKQENTKDWLVQHDVDIVAWKEIGVAFQMVSRQKRLAHRMKDIQ